MIALLLGTAAAVVMSRQALILENLALRHQIGVLRRSVKQPRLEPSDRGRQMSRANPLWGAPRIHGELLKLGLEISQAAVSKSMVRRRKPPSQNWRTFLENHAKDIVSLDFFTVPTATFRVFFVFVMLSRVKGLGIEQVVISARSPWQSPYVERVIGSIRREGLDHVIVLSEKQLRRLLRSYLAYYHGSRTHLGLAKDCPETRSVEPPHLGVIRAEPVVGGLHQRYFRRAA
jgi:hypothetical protein